MDPYNNFLDHDEDFKLLHSRLYLAILFRVINYNIPHNRINLTTLICYFTFPVPPNIFWQPCRKNPPFGEYMFYYPIERFTNGGHHRYAVNYE